MLKIADICYRVSIMTHDLGKVENKRVIKGGDLNSNQKLLKCIFDWMYE